MQFAFALGIALLAGVLALVSLVGRGHLTIGQIGTALRWVGLAGAALMAVLLAPRFWWLGVGAVGLWYALRASAPAQGGTQGTGAGIPGKGASRVRTTHLDAELDHQSGEVDACILRGEHEGRRLSELTLAELLGVLGEVAGEDPDSAAILEAYLDRTAPDWRDMVGDNAGSAGTETDDEGMGAARARKILGVGEDATETEIIAAHRRLISKLHPDRGGNAYLAAEVNRAKDVLLGG